MNHFAGQQLLMVSQLNSFKYFFIFFHKPPEFEFCWMYRTNKKSIPNPIINFHLIIYYAFVFEGYCSKFREPWPASRTFLNQLETFDHNLCSSVSTSSMAGWGR